MSSIIQSNIGGSILGEIDIGMLTENILHTSDKLFVNASGDSMNNILNMKENKIINVHDGKDLYDVVNNKRLKEKLDYNLTLIAKLSIWIENITSRVVKNAKHIESNITDELIFYHQLSN